MRHRVATHSSNQVPEWQYKYLDYNGLKLIIEEVKGNTADGRRIASTDISRLESSVYRDEHKKICEYRKFTFLLIGN